MNSLVKIFAATALSSLLVSEPVIADQGTADDIAITKVVDSWYLGRVYSSITWNNGVVIAKVFPYAIFFGNNGTTSIDTVVKNINGTWHVVLPSKGIVEQDLLTSLGVPLGTAQALLLECNQNLRRSADAEKIPLNRTAYFIKRIGNHYRRIRISRGQMPVILVRPIVQSRFVRSATVKPFDFYSCSS